MNLSLEYIAGFFDGEGCVSTHTNKARRWLFGTSIKIGQSGDDGKELLLMIKAWLADRGIRSCLGIQRQAKSLPHHKTMWGLRIVSRQGVIDFLTLVRPHVFMKKQIVEDTLRFLAAYQWPKRAA